MVIPKDIDLMDYASDAEVQAVWGLPQYDSDCKLFLDFEGVDDAQPTDADKSETPHTLTYYGDMDLDDTHDGPCGANTAVYAPDRVDNYIRITDDQSDWSMTGDFTIEGWHYLPDTSDGYDAILTQDSYPWGFWLYNGIPAFYDGNWHQSGSTFPTNQWVHWCVMRSGSGTNNTKIYIDGTIHQQWTNTNTFGQSAALAYGWGWGGQSGTDEFYGWGNKVKVTNGRALYDPSGFTPPTFMTSYETKAGISSDKRFGTSAVRLEFGAGLTSPVLGRDISLNLAKHKRIQGLIKCNRSDADIKFEFYNDRRIDSYDTVALPFDGSDGDTSTTDYGSEGTTWSFIGSAVLDDSQKKFGATSIYFASANSDYISATDNDDAFNVGSGEWCYEAWVRRGGGTGTRQVIWGQSDAAGNNNSVYVAFWETNYIYGIIFYSSSNVVVVQGTTTQITDSDWHHLALERDGDTARLYIDGVQEATGDLTGKSVNNSANPFVIGRNGAYTSLGFQGWLDDFRLTKGTARYRGNFTPSTSPLLGDLQSVPVTITRTGDWAVLDANISHIADSDKDNIGKIQFRVGDTTLPTYLDIDHLQAAGHRMWLDKFSYGSTSIFDTVWTTNSATRAIETSIKRDEYSSVKVEFSSSGDYISKIFDNPLDLTDMNFIAGKIRASNIGENVKLRLFDGEVGPEANLLLHLDGTDGDTSTTDDGETEHTVSFNNNAVIDDAQAKFGDTCLYVDGSGGTNISMSNHSDWDLADGDFTIDFWLRGSSFSNPDPVLICHWGNSPNRGWMTWMTATKMRFSYSTTGSDSVAVDSTTSVTWSTGVWYHMAYVRSGNTLYMFRDGVKLNETAFSVTIYHPSQNLVIGSYSTGGDNLTGWIDEIRIIKGTGLWTADFTPPTAPYVSGYVGTWREKNINVQRPGEWINWVWDIRGEETMTSVTEMRIESINSNIENTVYLNDFEARVNALSFLEAV